MPRVFAYGSNLCLERIRARAPSACVLATARLADHALRFHKKGRDGSGKADAFATRAAGSLVWGVVYELTTRDKRALDLCEGLGNGYFEKRVTLRDGWGSPFDAWVYVANPAWIDPSLSPYTWYKDFVTAGLRQHSLPPSYVRAVEAVAALGDPDAERAAGAAALLEARDHAGAAVHDARS